MKKIVVIYHKNCIDGFTGAWCAWKKFGDTAEYIGVAREEDPPQLMDIEQIYFIDFTYPLAVTERIVHDNTSVTILDHHISEKDAVALAHEGIFDNEHSGAVIAWNYFYPGQKLPELLKHVQDNDLFTRKLPFNKECIAALSIEPHEFARFSKLVELFESEEGQEHFKRAGSVLIQAEDFAINRLLASADSVVFEGYQALAVNTYLYHSQTAAAIYLKKGFPLGISWSYRTGGKIHVSLRSDGATVDCVALAKKYGGGGHKGAAGFIVDFNGSFPWKVYNGAINNQTHVYDTGTIATAPSN